MKDEMWLPVVGFEGVYEVSSFGQVRRSGCPGKGATIGKILKPAIRNGYADVALRKDGRTHYVNVHRLVCFAFHGQPPAPKMHVAHWNGNKLDNRKGNLRWATATENKKDGQRLGEIAKGEKAPHAKLTSAIVRQIRSSSSSRADLAVEHGVSRQAIDKIINRKSWDHID